MIDSPLIPSSAHLPRQAGAILHEDREQSAPTDLGTSSISVPGSTRTPSSVNLAFVPDGIPVRVKTEVELKGECVRRFDPVSAHHEVDTSDVYFEIAPLPGEEGLEADDFLLIGTHDMTDLEPLLHDAIVTLVDKRPLRGEDCQGLCDVCGEKRADLPADHLHESIDPRLAALASLLESNQKEVD